MEAIVFIIHQILFFSKRAVLSFLSSYIIRIVPSFSWGIFSHVTWLYQSRERKYLIISMNTHNMLSKQIETKMAAKPKTKLNEKKGIIPLWFLMVITWDRLAKLSAWLCLHNVRSYFINSKVNSMSGQERPLYISRLQRWLSCKANLHDEILSKELH